MPNRFLVLYLLDLARLDRLIGLGALHGLGGLSRCLTRTIPWVSVLNANW